VESTAVSASWRRRIARYIKLTNERPKQFLWTQMADEILASLPQFIIPNADNKAARSPSSTSQSGRTRRCTDITLSSRYVLRASLTSELTEPGKHS
jgi:hypothetical protein